LLCICNLSNKVYHAKEKFYSILVPTLHSANYHCSVGFEVLQMITVKIIAFWDILTRSSVNVLLDHCFLLVSYLAYSLFLKMEAVVPVEGRRTSAELHSVTSQETVLFIQRCWVFGLCPSSGF
jgi:hypothetical protein